MFAQICVSSIWLFTVGLELSVQSFSSIVLSKPDCMELDNSNGEAVSFNPFHSHRVLRRVEFYFNCI